MHTCPSDTALSDAAFSVPDSLSADGDCLSAPRIVSARPSIWRGGPLRRRGRPPLSGAVGPGKAAACCNAAGLPQTAAAASDSTCRRRLVSLFSHCATPPPHGTLEASSGAAPWLAVSDRPMSRVLQSCLGPSLRPAGARLGVELGVARSRVSVMPLPRCIML